MSDLAFFLDAEQIGGEADVVEVELGAFGEAFPVVAVVGLEPVEQEADFEEKKPVFGGDAGDACVIGQGGNVEGVSDTPGAPAYEAVEEVDVADLGKAANVSLDVVGVVVGVKAVGSDFGMIFQKRVEAVQEVMVYLGWRFVAALGQLGEGEGK